MKIFDEKRYKIIFICFAMILAALCTGCKSNTKEEHLSDLLNLKDEKIADVYSAFFSPPIAQNDKYVYYETNDKILFGLIRETIKKQVFYSWGSLEK